MADNVQMNAATEAGGDKAVAAAVSFSGETAQAQGVFVGCLSGSAESYSFTPSPGGAGAVNAGTPRVTLASDDPAVTRLQRLYECVGEDAEGPLTYVMMMGGAEGVNVRPVQMHQVSADDVAGTERGIVTASFGHMFDGTTWDRLRGNATDGLLVNLGVNNDVTIGAALPTGANTIGDVTISGATATAIALLDDIVFVDDAAFTPASSKVAAIGYLFDDVSTDTVNEGDIGIPRMSSNRVQYSQLRDAAGNERGANVDSSNRLLVLATQSGTYAVTDNSGSLTVDAPVGTPVFVRLSDGSAAITTLPVSLASVPSHAVTNAGTFAVQVAAIASGGATMHKTVSAASTNATSVKGSAGTVYGIQVTNVNAAARYLKLYNKASAPTVGTDTPVKTLVIPGNTAGAGSNVPIPTCGLEFTTGIAFALTTESTDAGSTGVAANEIVVNIDYK